MLLFPAEPFAGRKPDGTYAGELSLAQQAGLDTTLLDTEALLDGDLTRALRWLSRPERPHPALYRGWMLRPEVYTHLYAGLLERGWTLINTPEQYLHTHNLPQSFAAIADVSPRTLWLPAAVPADLDWDAVHAALESFGAAPIIVKDYVKSRKHEWNEACYIPDASDTVQAGAVIQTFLTRQGSEFQGGLVLRAFEQFAALSIHSRSGMPLTREYRLFFLNGQIVSAAAYWEEGDYPAEQLPLEFFLDIGSRVQSRFFSMDVAQRSDGGWRVMELGDGQVAGLPERADGPSLYTALAEALRG